MTKGFLNIRQIQVVQITFLVPVVFLEDVVFVPIAGYWIVGGIAADEVTVLPPPYSESSSHSSS